MPEIQLTAETGRKPGSRPSRRLRAAGKVPGVVYGHGIDPIAVAVDVRDLRHALNTEAGGNALLNLKVDGADHLTMAKVLQRDPVRNTVNHVDFQIVRRDEIVSADVPVQLRGDAHDLHVAGGVVDQQMFTVAVYATPANIPAHIEVDVSALQIGDSIRIADLVLPSGVTTELDPEEAVVVGQPPQGSELDLIPEADVEALQELAAAQEAEGGDTGEGAGGDGATSSESSEG
jgi:large subunit ribosomal protein L25